MISIAETGMFFNMNIPEILLKVFYRNSAQKKIINRLLFPSLIDKGALSALKYKYTVLSENRNERKAQKNSI